VKHFLLIPACILFLSNIPFVQQMKMEKPVVKEKCCKKKTENLMESCHKPKDEKSTRKECCNKTETTCVCICCFQFAAPGPITPKFDFIQKNKDKLFSAFHNTRWKDPFVSIPWQPPDMILFS